MKKKQKVKVQHGILTLMFMLGLLLGMSATVWADGSVPYLAWDTDRDRLVEVEGGCTNYTVVTSVTTSWGDGWYVVPEGEVTISERISVNGTAHLILCDGAKLTARYGITVNNNNALNIYGQSKGTGMLVATGFTSYNHDTKHRSYYPGIGADDITFAAGDIIIHGGTVTAQGYLYSPGIGGLCEDWAPESQTSMFKGTSGGNVMIYHGTVAASIEGVKGNVNAIGKGSSGKSDGDLTLGKGVKLYGNPSKMPEGVGDTDLLATGNGGVYSGKRNRYMKTVPPPQYQLVYDPGEGSGSMDPEKVFDGALYTFPECTFKKPKDKAFNYWIMSGVDGIYSPGETVQIASNCADQAGVITVTAYWKDAPEPTTKPTTKTTTKSKQKPAAKSGGTPLTKMTPKGDHSLTISWMKVSGAAGYEIYFARCDGKGSTATKKVKTIKGNRTFTWTVSGLHKTTAYKAYVKAYVKKNGEKKYIGTSPMIHVYTSGYSPKYTNAKAVTVNKTKVKLKKGKTFQIKAKVRKLKKNRKLMPPQHVKQIRYLSTNKKIATVTKGGKIKAKKKGTCYIYVYAHNGISKKIKVIVR